MYYLKLFTVYCNNHLFTKKRGLKKTRVKERVKMRMKLFKLCNFM